MTLRNIHANKSVVERSGILEEYRQQKKIWKLQKYILVTHSQLQTHIFLFFVALIDDTCLTFTVSTCILDKGSATAGRQFQQSTSFSVIIITTEADSPMESLSCRTKI